MSCYSVLQYVAVRRRVLRCVAVGVVCCSGCSVLQCVAVCCSVLQRVAVIAVWCSMLQCVAVCCRVSQLEFSEASSCNERALLSESSELLKCVIVCGSALQCVAAWCVVLQYAAVCCSVLQCAFV